MINQIKVQRAIHSLTQEDLANKIGVSRQTINSIEKNRYVPSTVLALKMARVFNVPVERFIQLDQSELKEICES